MLTIIMISKDAHSDIDDNDNNDDNDDMMTLNDSPLTQAVVWVYML